jgi:hypothetical protein
MQPRIVHRGMEPICETLNFKGSSWLVEHKELNIFTRTGVMYLKYWLKKPVIRIVNLTILVAGNWMNVRS